MSAITLDTVRRDALLEALDQYVSNQSEHEENEGIPESPRLRAAREIMDELLAPIAALAESGPAVASKRVKWGRPIVGDGWNEYELRSKCERFVIRKRMMSGSRNGSWKPDYQLFIRGELQKWSDFERLCDAKEDAEAIAEDEESRGVE